MSIKPRSFLDPNSLYDLATNTINSKTFKLLKDCQNQCICQMFGGRSSSSSKVMLQVTNLPHMQERTHILQAQYILRPLQLSNDTLLAKLVPLLRQSRSFRRIRRAFLRDSFSERRNGCYSKYLSACQNATIVNPILWLSSNSQDRSRLIRYCPSSCPLYPDQSFTRSCAIHCLQIHNRL
ncbi:hypothetical protein EDC96DRAFT_550711 [Choanephora cucurbitarum]|nr:hypothetical protein EDC96DRAFT_550711 [Choanephora cucurbitarum]